MTAAQEWLEAVRTVEAARSRRIAATPEAVLAAATTDLAVTEPAAVFTFPVPELDPPLTCWVLRSGRGASIQVRGELPSAGPNTVASVDMATGLRSSLAVEPARGGSRARLTLSIDVQRQQARDARAALESRLDAALARLTLVATGF